MLVIIPTYNERDSLPGVVDRLHAAVPEAGVLIVDDSSPEGTGQLADRLAEDRPWVPRAAPHGEDRTGRGLPLGFRLRG